MDCAVAAVWSSAGQLCTLLNHSRSTRLRPECGPVCPRKPRASVVEFKKGARRRKRKTGERGNQTFWARVDAGRCWRTSSLVKIIPSTWPSHALGHLRVKIPQLRLALEGKIRPHHRFFATAFGRSDTVCGTGNCVARRNAWMTSADKDRTSRKRLIAGTRIPGIDRVAAWALLAEIGDNMGQFPTADHLASWTALCPGNHESAGKRLRGTTRVGGAHGLCRDGLSVCLGCRANQEHLLILAVQTLSGKTRQEKSHHRGGAYHHCHRLSLAEEPAQLRGSWRETTSIASTPTGS